MKLVIEKLELCLIPNDQMLSIVPLLRLRNAALSEQTLTERVAEMRGQGFQCLGAYHQGKLIGICGFWIKTRYHTGKLIEPDGVFVLDEYRSAGVGAKMMDWVYAYGKEQGCLESELHCYVTNSEAHRFWLNQGYKIVAFHFGKNL
jgi:GNAT superfamily N-acetyltransferase